MGILNKRELDALVEDAIVDAYDEYEQTTSFAVMIGDIPSLAHRGVDHELVPVL